MSTALATPKFDLDAQVADKTPREVRIMARNLLLGKSLGTNKAMKVAILSVAHHLLGIAIQKYMVQDGLTIADVAQAVKQLDA